MNNTSHQYDKIAVDYRKGEETIQKEHINKATFLHLVSSFNLEGKSVIDLGCGSGYSTRLLTSFKPKKIVGTDISREQIKLAKEIEKRENQGIEYIAADTKNLTNSITERFDYATALFLLHYSRTRRELEQMCKSIYDTLQDKGVFIAVNGHPTEYKLKTPKYGCIVETTLPEKEGGERKVSYLSEGKKMFTFTTYYWRKETYENALKKAGFKKIEWKHPTVSKKGMEKYGKSFWKEFLENPSIIGIVCYT